MGGSGGGIAYNREDLVTILERGLDLSPVHEVLIEESALGWKEFELEVMRDLADNVIIVCSIENFDPMGVHTGDSITVAPAQTLTDREYQMMRDGAIRCLREIGVDTGGSNVQFAINPKDGRMVIIEMNPRVSRSSALASKATGLPDRQDCRQAGGRLPLDEIRNDITKVTPASFEPTIDYVVVKIPKWAFEKFPGADQTLGTQMKSVGEVMAIGRTFKEALGKGIRSLETGKKFGSETFDVNLIPQKLITPTPDRSAICASPLRRAIPWSDPRNDGDRSVVLEQLRQNGRIRTAWTAVARQKPIRATAASQASWAFPTCRWPSLENDEIEVRARRKELGVRRRLQSRRHLLGRIRKLHPLSLFHLRNACEAAPTNRKKGDDSGQRTEPHRPGHRVRLLLLPRLLRAAGEERRIDHGELQSRDRLDRLRHQRPPLLRAADARKRPQHRGCREARRRHRAVRRADSADAGAAAEALGVPIIGTDPETSTSRKTANCSASCSTNCKFPRPKRHRNQCG
jgi:carbamoyl-phosphate synthase large subunit